MRRAERNSLAIKVDKRSRRPLPQQIYEGVQKLILEQKLAPGSEMPSSRVLSDSLGVARASVVMAYEILKREGYMETRIGGRSWVCRTLPVIEPAPLPRKGATAVALSHYAQRLLSRPSHYPAKTQKSDFVFSYWDCAVDPDPLRVFMPYFNRISRSMHSNMLDYPRDPLGYKPLREAIARSLRKTHGITCDADDVLIIAGIPQALNLIARIHIERGDFVAVENPGYPPIRDLFEMEGGVIVPVAVDDLGMVTDELLSHVDKRIRLAYLTPSHQFPTGMRLDLSRRLELLSWARITGAVLIEDEHDSAFNYNGEIVPSIKALDRDQSVVFVGTFGKILFPSLAVAYLVLPTSLREAYVRAREESSDQIPLIVQAALAEFIRSGGQQKHVRKMRGIYQERRDALVEALARAFKERIQIRGEQAGLHLTVRLKSKLSTDEIVRKARDAGVSITATSSFYTSEPVPNEFILGFANLEPHQIHEAVHRLASLV